MAKQHDYMSVHINCSRDEPERRSFWVTSNSLLEAVVGSHVFIFLFLRLRNTSFNTIVRFPFTWHVHRQSASGGDHPSASPGNRLSLATSFGAEASSGQILDDHRELDSQPEQLCRGNPLR